jgi:hypothetical protein
MFTFHAGRAVAVGDAVRVHRNLNNGMWVITATTGAHKGLVVAYADAVALDNVTTKVSVARQAKVAAGAHRDVHAWLVGTLSTVCDADDTMGRVVTYRPHVAPVFIYADDGAVIDHVARVVFRTDSKCYAA